MTHGRFCDPEAWPLAPVGDERICPTCERRYVSRPFCESMSALLGWLVRVDQPPTW